MAVLKFKNKPLKGWQFILTILVAFTVANHVVRGLAVVTPNEPITLSNWYRSIPGKAVHSVNGVRVFFGDLYMRGAGFCPSSVNGTCMATFRVSREILGLH